MTYSTGRNYARMAMTQLKAIVFLELGVESIKELKRQYPEYRHFNFRTKAAFLQILDPTNHPDPFPPTVSANATNDSAWHESDTEVEGFERELRWLTMSVPLLKIEVCQQYGVSDMRELRRQFRFTFGRLESRDLRKRETYIELLRLASRSFTRAEPVSLPSLEELLAPVEIPAPSQSTPPASPATPESTAEVPRELTNAEKLAQSYYRCPLVVD